MELLHHEVKPHGIPSGSSFLSAPRVTPFMLPRHSHSPFFLAPKNSMVSGVSWLIAPSCTGPFLPRVLFPLYSFPNSEPLIRCPFICCIHYGTGRNCEYVKNIKIAGLRRILASIFINNLILYMYKPC